MQEFNSWRQFESWIDQKGPFHMDFGLQRIRSALSKIGVPAYPLIQVLGSNGKGSTSAFLAALAEAHGLKTGLYISPHFVSIKERILVNGRQVEDDIWLDCANSLKNLPLASELTYFEFLTALAAMLFARMGVDAAIFEAGLGGAHDATTALPAIIHCYTPIGMDHAGVIGPTLADIAQDKAGAMRPRSRVFSAPQYPIAAAALQRHAKRVGANLCFVEPLPHGAKTGLRGAFQLTNAAVALSAWRELAAGLGIASGNESRGLASAFIAGRLHQIRLGDAHFLLDGAHNPHAMRALLANLPFNPDLIVFSALGDKNWRDCLAMLLRLQCPVLIPQLGNGRAAQAAQMAEWANGIRRGSARPASNSRRAFEAARQRHANVLVCGSLYLLSEFFSVFPEYLQKDDAEWNLANTNLKARGSTILTR